MPFVPLADVQEYVDWLGDGGQLHFTLFDLPDSFDDGHSYTGFFDYLKAEPGRFGFLPAALVGDGVGEGPRLGDFPPWAATCSTYLALSDPVVFSVAINVTIGEPPSHHEYDMTDLVVERWYYDNPDVASHVIQLDALGTNYAIQISKWDPSVSVNLRKLLTERWN